MMEVMVLKTDKMENTSHRINKFLIKELDTGEIYWVNSKVLKSKVIGGVMHLTNYRLAKGNRLVRIPKEINTVYFMMNKDKVVGKFDLEAGKIKVGSNLPLNFRNLHGWVSERRTFNCVDSHKFYMDTRMVSDDLFIEQTHCVSLHDTFWLKKANSKLTWDDVSPYKADRYYSQLIAEYALDGYDRGFKSVAITENTYYSPVLGTRGSFPHSWTNSKGKIEFIKGSSKYTLGCMNSGNEPYSEYYASKVGKYLGFNCVEYRLAERLRLDGNNELVTICKAFTNEEIGSISAHDLDINTYNEVIKLCKRLSEEAFNTCLDMLFLDCLLVNTDRHFNNIEFLTDNATQKVLGLAPIFDNNMALLPYFVLETDEFCMSDYSARDGSTFRDLFRLISEYKSYKEHLLKLRNFKLEAPDDVQIDTDRLEFLNKFMQARIDYFLGIIEFELE